MKNETKYTLDDILKVIQKLPESEKEFLMKKASVSDVLKIYNDRNEYCRLVKGIEDGIAELNLWKSSTESLYKELNKYDSDTVYKYANIKVAPEIDGYCFARMVNVVAEVTQRDIKHCCAEIMVILDRLYFIKRCYNGEIENDTLETVNILKSFNIDLDKKVFWILNDIHTKWESYTLAQQAAIASLIIDGTNTETFLALLENWDKIDNRVPSSDIKAIITEIESIEDREPYRLKEAILYINGLMSERDDKNNE